jgi:GT2 family glycosyltransferase
MDTSTSPVFLYESHKHLISACIVTRNACDSLKCYLDSLSKSVEGSYNLEIIVVDNDSSDDTANMLKEFYPQAKNFFCQPGVGFSKGINKAIANSQGEFIVIATPSTEIIGDTIPVLLEYLNWHKNVGVVGPKVINPDGKTQHSSKKMPNPRVAMIHTLHHFGIIRSNRLLDQYFLFNYESDEPLEVTSLTMSLMIARRKVFEDIGFLDENIFAWSSDVDWCYLVEKSPWSQMFIPKARVIHRRNSVSKKQPYTNLIHYHQDINYFYKKHYEAKTSPLANLFWKASLQLRLLALAIMYIVKGDAGFSYY